MFSAWWSCTSTSLSNSPRSFTYDTDTLRICSSLERGIVSTS